VEYVLIAGFASLSSYKNKGFRKKRKIKKINPEVKYKKLKSINVVNVTCK
jgi:hypothetical protein